MKTKVWGSVPGKGEWPEKNLGVLGNDGKACVASIQRGRAGNVFRGGWRRIVLNLVGQVRI